MTRGAPSRAQYGVHDGGGGHLKGRFKGHLKGRLKGHLRGRGRALKDGFRGPLGGTLRGALRDMVLLFP